MPGWIKKLLVSVLAVTAGLVVFVWLVLAAPFFSEFRRTIVQTALSEQIDHALLIQTDVRAVVGIGTHLSAHDVVIPSEEIEGLNLAELERLELDIDLIGLLSGGLNIDNVKVDGLRVNLIKQEDGTTSWSDVPESADSANSAEPKDLSVESGIIAFLSDKNVELSSISMTYQNNESGFEYLFDLEALTIEQTDFGEAVVLASHGSINQLPFEIDGTYPSGAMSSTTISAGGIDVSFDAQAVPEDQGGGFSGELALDTGEIADILDVLQLDGEVAGTGNLTAGLLRQGETLEVTDLRVGVDFANGSEVTLEGSADDLWSAVEFDVTLAGRLFPEGQTPSRATELEDLAFTGFSADLKSEAGAVEIKDVLLETNFIDATLKEIGPITVGRVRRTENETLALENINAQTGPRASPYVTAQGSIQDVLRLRQIAFTGTLNAPASLILSEITAEHAAAFGGISAEFELSDASGELSLSKLEARSDNTELWSLKASAAARSVRRVNGLDVHLDLDIPDGATFLSALHLKEIDTGPLAYSSTVRGSDTGLDTRLSIRVGQSQLDTDLNTVVDKNGVPTVRGRIQSERLDVHDLSNAVKAAGQVSSLAKESQAETPEREVQPLVIEPEAITTDPDARADGRVAQPLVLPEGGDLALQSEEADGGGSERVTDPSVVSDTKPAERAIDLLDLDQIGRDLDLEIAIEIAEVKGQAGVSRISSELISKDGRADLGPIELQLGGGYFNLGAAVDFIDAPQLARIFGATSGWDFGRLLNEIGAGIDARGELRAQFDLTGSNRSARSFIDSMSGSVTVSMVNGAIATSLLELAGLGVFPWLFSKELQQGYTDIVCVVAPLRIDGGKASSNAVVLETKSVQLVAAGSADWKNDKISIRAEPRPVGRPLARSAWPFEVTGRLSNPDFKLGKSAGQKRSQPEPGQSPQPRTPCKPDIQQ